ncbi:MAG TPA: M23 family metallopeptidase [Luteimonas sp.]|nr:M23 family metallopeptidase [Luteimonas sp.]
MRWLLALALLLATANLAWWLLRGSDGPLWRANPTVMASADTVAAASTPDAAATHAPVATEAPPTPPDPGAATAAPPAPPVAAAPATPQPPAVSPSGLIVPVRGVRPDQLHDTFGDARGSERSHEALDIMAPAGTPVLAVADGHVEKLFDSERGGLTIYQFEDTGTWCYYYAHLQSYAPGLAEGQAVERGEVIGYVGSSGNADPAAPHLHFAVFALTPERQWWKGEAINPYPLLGAGPGSGGSPQGQR